MAAFSVFTKSLGRTWLNQDVLIPLKQCGKVKKKAAAFVRCFSDSEQYVLKSSYSPIKVPQMPIHEFVFQHMNLWESKLALECGVTGKKVTYKDLYNTTRVLARSLQKKFKLKKGDCLFILLPNCTEYPSIILAGSMAGLVSTTSNPLYTAYEISHQISSTQPKIIFTMPQFYEACMGALNKLQKELPIVVVRPNPSSSLPPGAIDFAEVAYSSNPVNLDPVNFDFSSNAVLPFSSGTSGLPKGVQLSHENVIANLVQMKAQHYFRIKSDKENNQTVGLGILPMFHIYGMVAVTMDSLSAGDRLVTLPKFDPKLLVETIYTKKTSLLFLVPPLIFFLAHQSHIEGKHLQYVTSVLSGAAPFGALDGEAFKKKVPHVLMCQGYGLTETSPVVTFSNKDRLHKMESVGHPLSSTEVKIADIETGKPVPKGTRGEICVKGPQVMKGYLGQDDGKKEAFDSDGWLRTGDIGYFDDEGDMFVSDRIKELIKVKGFQVAPAEIEETLRSHPKIADVGVIGVPHPTMGQVPKAFVTVKSGASLTKEDVIPFIKERLSSYKQLQGGVTFINSIPRSSTGKILRNVLREMHEKSE